MALSSKVPVVLLKTRSQPNDTYEEYFSTLSSEGAASRPSTSFEPVFMPVLEHKQDEQALGSLSTLLSQNKMKETYGGMIFTSQRAVEGWADAVIKVEEEVEAMNNMQLDRNDDAASNDALVDSDITPTSVETAIDTRSNQPFTSDITSSTPFPLYTVGPATSRALTTLLVDCASRSCSQFTRLNPEILGSHTGNGASLAKYMLHHYNTIHSHRYFTYFEAPRLPFIPLLGMGSENYSRKRLEATDPRLQKKPLLFLVGEQRRDIIPRTLMDSSLDEARIEVEEVEVYSTIVKSDFKSSFMGLISSQMNSQPSLVVIVVFSPQGSDAMLQSLNLVDENNKLTDKARHRWDDDNNHSSPPQNKSIHDTKYVIATIGPTTRDHLLNTFGFEPDICASKPSPEGLGQGIVDFLKRKKTV